MPANKLTAPYGKRIEAYCLANGFSVPAGFHNRTSCKFAILDCTSMKLVAVTYFLEADVIAFVSALQNAARKFRVLDFKRGRELAHVGGKKLIAVGVFDHKLPNEIEYLVQP
jgi:hypothetical protein